jgi:hypothetical protein
VYASQSNMSARVLRLGWAVNEFALTVLYIFKSMTPYPRSEWFKNAARCIIHLYFLHQLIESLKITAPDTLREYDMVMAGRVSFLLSIDAFVQLECFSRNRSFTCLVFMLMKFAYRLSTAIGFIFFSLLEKNEGQYFFMFTGVIHMFMAITLAYLQQMSLHRSFTNETAFVIAILFARECICIIGSTICFSFLARGSIYDTTTSTQIVLLSSLGSPLSVSFLFERAIFRMFSQHIERAIREISTYHSHRPISAAHSIASAVKCPLCRSPVEDACRAARVDTCCICSEAPAECTLLPCAHDSFCLPCARLWSNRHGGLPGVLWDACAPQPNADHITSMSGRRWIISNGRHARPSQ